MSLVLSYQNIWNTLLLSSTVVLQGKNILTRAEKKNLFLNVPFEMAHQGLETLSFYQNAW